MLFDFDLANGCMKMLLSFEEAVASHRFKSAAFRAEHFVCLEEDRSRAVETPVRVVIPWESQREQVSEFSSDCVGREHCVGGHLTTMAPGFECAALRARHFVCLGEDRSRAVEIPFEIVLALEAQSQKVSGHSSDCVGRMYDNGSSLRRSLAPFPEITIVSLLTFTLPGHQHPDTVGMNLSHQFAYRSGGSVRKLVLEACRCHCYRSTLSARHATLLSTRARKLLINQLPIISKKSDSITSKNYYH